MRIRNDGAEDVVALHYRTGAQSQNLSAVEELDQILDEDEHAEGGEEEDEIRGILAAEGEIDQPVNG